MAAGAVTALKINVEELAAISAYLGTVVAGKIYSSLFRSAAQGASNYVEINTGDSPLKVVEGNKTALELWTSNRHGLSGSGGSILFRDTGVDDDRGYITPINGSIGGYDGLAIVAEDGDVNEKDLVLYGDIVRIAAQTGVIIQPVVGTYSPIYLSGTINLVGNSRINSNLLPLNNGDGSVGNSSYRWEQVRAVNIQSGDLCFAEEICPICGEKFKDGDVIVLLCKTVHEDFGTMTIPMHDKCKDIPATLTMEVPETETRYRFNPEIGDVEPYHVSKFVEQEEEIPRVRDGFELDELTGQFTKKALVVKVAKEGYVGKRAETGAVKFYDELTDQEVPLRSILEPVEVFPERLAAKDETIETVTIKRRRSVIRSISIKVGSE